MAALSTRNQLAKQQRNTSVPATTTSSATPEASNSSNMLTPKMLSDSKIGAAIQSLRDDIKLDIDSARGELSAAVTSLQTSLASHNTRLKELEKAADYTGDCITELRATVSQLQGDVRELQAKCEDLEGRSRRNNLRLTGVGEGLENGQPTQFVSQLLKHLHLSEAPLLDRAHRSLRAKPKPGDPPRVFITRVHYTHMRDEILRKSSRAPLIYKGKMLHIYPDYTIAVMKKRAAFGDVKRKLRSIEGGK
ncbi:hypothetical protein L3Q82_002848 [Scortum barcoo]|uniref:Uncharacterized protein n=1 Tax=Scortum barcoo TaxID=214431 RepID=A0ACB8VV12_9TELE|nr:hypothetical protein L3Q82_002848 [Scortum barcoo]